MIVGNTFLSARPDLAFAYSQLSKFVQYPGIVHLQAAERVLCAGPTPGNFFLVPGGDTKNKLIGWVDSDFGSDPDTRKSMTLYILSLNGGTIFWKSSRQGGFTLSSRKAEKQSM